jgi:hypothetical protein
VKAFERPFSTTTFFNFFLKLLSPKRSARLYSCASFTAMIRASFGAKRMMRNNRGEATMTATTVRAEEQTMQESTDKREANGRFAKGNRGGPGNPFARQVAALRQTLLNRATTKDLEEIADELIKKAKTGDVAATKLLFQYTLGKPLPARTRTTSTWMNGTSCSSTRVLPPK